VGWGKKHIEKIEAYTRANSKLLKAHHFLYDLRLNQAAKRADFVVMGINPGETKQDWDITKRPAQETSEYDFHTGHERSRSSARWIRLCKEILGTENVVLAELFFWSSKNITCLEKRFGFLKNSPHPRFCAEMNKKLFAHHMPKAIIFPGLGSIKLAADLYGLARVKTVKSSSSRLIEHYTMGETPWLFTKHWTGSFGFSNSQKNRITQYIRNATC
jgi:hypothetical protein